jgi:hypothetical protein
MQRRIDHRDHGDEGNVMSYKSVTSPTLARKNWVAIVVSRKSHTDFLALYGIGRLTDRMKESVHVFEVRPRNDRRGVDIISDVLPFGCLWYGGPNATSNAIEYAKFYSRSHDAVIRVYDDAGNVIEMHDHTGEFKGW